MRGLHKEALSEVVNGAPNVVVLAGAGCGDAKAAGPSERDRDN